MYPNRHRSDISLNLRKNKWLLCGCYHTQTQSVNYFFYNLGNSLDKYNHYDKILLIGDFNGEDFDPIFSEFLSTYDAKNIVKAKTCFKNITNASCIGFVLDL